MTFGWALVVSGLALSMRLENAVPVGALFAVALFYYFDDHPLRVPSVVSTVLVAGYLLVSLFRNKLSLDYFVYLRNELSTGDAAYLERFVYETPLEFTLFLPLGLVYFLLVPLPWHTINMLSWLAIMQNLLVWYPVLAMSLVGMYRYRRTQPVRVTPLLVYAGAGLVLYGSVHGNIGAAMRHRMQFQLVFFVFAGLFLADHHDRIRTWLSDSFSAISTIGPSRR